MGGLGKQEEKPKGEIIMGPSGEALEPPDSGNTPFHFLSGNLFIQLKYLLISSSSQIPFCTSGIVSFTEESSEEDE